MGYTSLDDIYNQITVNGKARLVDHNKSTAPAHTATAGWHLLAGLAGSGGAATFPGTDLLWSSCDEFSGDGTTVFGMPNGGAVSPATKHVLSANVMITAAAGAPWVARLVDLQGYYRMSTTNVTGTGSRALINSNTFTASSSSGLLLTFTNDFKSGTKVRFVNSGGALPTGLSAGTDYWLIRQSATTAKVATSYANYVAGTAIAYTDAGSGTNTLWIQMRSPLGVGCEALFAVYTAPTGGGPNLSASAYDNTGVATPGTGTRAFQGSVTNGAAADAYATRITHSGSAAGRYGPFLPRQGGDTGIERINSFTWSGGTAYTGSGVVALCIVKPIDDVILELPLTNSPNRTDYVCQFPSLPKVEDGACLTWLLQSAGATTTGSPFTSAVKFGWAGS